jgi:hypothetical protein
VCIIIIIIIIIVVVVVVINVRGSGAITPLAPIMEVFESSVDSAGLSWLSSVPPV